MNHLDPLAYKIFDPPFFVKGKLSANTTRKICGGVIHSFDVLAGIMDPENWTRS
jgi:hypothetical protein